jgi:hypothetical protein
MVGYSAKLVQAPNVQETPAAQRASVHQYHQVRAARDDSNIFTLGEYRVSVGQAAG